MSIYSLFYLFIISMHTPITTMRWLIIHVFRVAFFFEKEERISRGEYRVGIMMLMFIASFVALIVSFIIDSRIINLLLFLVIYIVPWVNLLIKRAHDLNMPGRRVAALLVPGLNVYLSIMFLFSPAYNDNNAYGEDPLKHIPSNNVWYRAVCIALYVSYILIQIAPNFIDVIGRLGAMTSSRVPEPDASMNPYTMMNTTTSSYGESDTRWEE